MAEHQGSLLKEKEMANSRRDEELLRVDEEQTEMLKQFETRRLAIHQHELEESALIAERLALQPKITIPNQREYLGSTTAPKRSKRQSSASVKSCVECVSC